MAAPTQPRHLVVFADEKGREPVTEWLATLSSQHNRRVRSRIDRMTLGNFGDHRGVGEGVQELRLHFGSGYRVYFAEDGATLVVLLCGGDKRSQRRDIKRAKEYWQDYLQNKEET